MKPQNRSEDPLAFIDDLSRAVTHAALIALAAVVVIASIALL
ncbi:hypothetical protein [Variovorax sp.]|jgi:hypothetical protein